MLICLNLLKKVTIIYLEEIISSYGSWIDKVAWESCSFEFVHFWEVEIQFEELGWDFGPKSWLVWLQTFSDVSSVWTWVSKNVSIKLSWERSSEAPGQKYGIENTHTEKVHSAWSHTSFCPSCFKYIGYLGAICWKSKLRGTWELG